MIVCQIYFSGMKMVMERNTGGMLDINTAGSMQDINTAGSMQDAVMPIHAFRYVLYKGYRKRKRYFREM